jgi:transcriptional regulator with XRE-family HTH domain
VIQELKEMGLNQSMIAREMHVERQTVNQWFIGARTPSARSIKRMAAAMSELTGKKVAPADVYNLITAVVERNKKEKA